MAGTFRGVGRESERSFSILAFTIPLTYVHLSDFPHEHLSELIMDIFLIFLILLCSKVGSATVNITRTRFLKDADVITSNNNQFQLGFFSPGNSTSRYVGIWYKTAPDEVVWVANRDSPLKDFSGVFKVSEDGNLQVLDGQNSVLWSSNISQTNPSSKQYKL